MTYQSFGVLLNWDAANFGIALVVGFAVLVVVSLMTPPEAAERLRPFYERLDRVSYLDKETGEEKDSDEPGHDLLFVHLFDLGLEKGLGAFYKRFRVDINGL